MVLFPNGETAGPPRGNSRYLAPVGSPIRSWPETRYAWLLSGCRHTRRSCWTCFTIVEMSCAPGIPSLIGPSLRYGVILLLSLLIVRACDGLSWDTPAGYDLSKAVPAVMWQIGIC